MSFSASTPVSPPVGIVSYGAYLPNSCLTATELCQARGLMTSEGQVDESTPRSLGVRQKTVPAGDEDTATLATAAAEQALERLETAATIGALFIGSESHPYAVKPTGTIVKQALGLADTLALADLQFACKAGTQAVQIGYTYVASGQCDYALAIGSDTAQAAPGDVLEFTAGAGAAAYILGRETASQPVLARLLGTLSIATDTPDFWRRPGQAYPQHAGRFSGEPAYFYHVSQAAQQLMAKLQLTPSQFEYCVFHTPNAKFPQAVAAKLGFSPEQLAPSLVVKQIGNTYAAASLLALAAVLDQAQAGQKILVVSYGSGAGADAFVWQTTPALVSQRAAWQLGQKSTATSTRTVATSARTVQSMIDDLSPISYSEYRQRMELVMGGEGKS